MGTTQVLFFFNYFFIYCLFVILSSLRCFQCLAEVYSDLGKPSLAMSCLAKCLWHCEKHFFAQQPVKVKLQGLLASVAKNCSISFS